MLVCICGRDRGKEWQRAIFVIGEGRASQHSEQSNSGENNSHKWRASRSPELERLSSARHCHFGRGAGDSHGSWRTIRPIKVQGLLQWNSTSPRLPEMFTIYLWIANRKETNWFFCPLTPTLFIHRTMLIIWRIRIKRSIVIFRFGIK